MALGVCQRIEHSSWLLGNCVVTEKASRDRAQHRVHLQYADALQGRARDDP